MALRNPEDSGFFRALDCVEFESAAVKENGRLQMLPIAEAMIVCLIVWIFELGPSLVALVTQVPRPGGRQDAASRHPGIGRKAINPFTVLVVTDKLGEQGRSPRSSGTSVSSPAHAQVWSSSVNSYPL